jgi:putative transferase (TIGR04331 family)
MQAARTISNRPGEAMRRVIAGSIPDDFDPRQDLVPGPWVLTGQEDRWPGWESHDFRLPLQTAEDISAADDETARIAVALTAEFADRLEARHNAGRSPEFWYLLLIRWVLETVQAAWLRYHEAQQLVAEAGGSALLVEAPASDRNWRFRDIGDMYRRGICALDYNAWLLAEALEVLAPGRVERKIMAESQSVGETEQAPKASLKQRLFAALKEGRCEVGNMGSEYNLRTKLFSAAAHLVLNLWLELIPAKKEIRSCRAKADPDLAASVGPDLAAYLVSVLERSLPLPFGEEFADADREVRRIKPRKGRISIKTISYQMTAPRLFEAAHRIEGGEGLVHLQHGCNYGICRAWSLGAIIEYNQHAFLTWGWSSHGQYDGRFVPVPAPQIAPWQDRHRVETNEILLVSSIAPFLPNRLISNGELHCYNRRAERERFIASLSDGSQKELRYRPYPQLPYGAEDAGYFARRFPELVQIGSQLEFFRASRRCRLLVTDHPGLTFYQAIVAGTPIMGFWTDLQWPIDPSVKPMFDDLRRCGVLFDDPAEAARSIDAHGDALEDWWQGEEVQAAIGRLRDYNTRTGNGWLLTWLKMTLDL